MEWCCKIIVRLGIKIYKLKDSYQEVYDGLLLQRFKQEINTSNKEE